MVIEGVPFAVFHEMLHFCYQPSLSTDFQEKYIPQLAELNQKYKVIGLHEALEAKLKVSILFTFVPLNEVTYLEE